jgi:polyisoprenoid-binding protein YceI
MMENLNFKYLTISFLALLFTINATAQDVYKLNEKNSSLLITGTSTVHDWEMKAEKFNCETAIKKGEEGTLNINQINFSCSTEEIKSHNRIMDGKTRDALKEKKYPEINFRLENPENVQYSGGIALVKGKLTIAGETREINIPSQFDFGKNNSFSVKGEIPLKMSDFGVVPPTAMMGALKTGDEVVIKYNFQFDKTSNEITRNN